MDNAIFCLAIALGCGLLFKKGEIIRKVPESELCGALRELIESEVSG